MTLSKPVRERNWREDLQDIVNSGGDIEWKDAEDFIDKLQRETLDKIKSHKCPRHQLFCACQMEILNSLKDSNL